LLQRVRVISQTDLDASPGSDEIGFAQTQAVEIIQTKARRASSAIESTCSVLSTLDDHMKRLARTHKHPETNLENDNHESLHDELMQLKSHLELSSRKARDIVEATASVNMLIQRILDLRSYSTLHNNNASLRHISESTAMESTTMMQLTDASRKDARIMKVASIIALVYLPASLVTSIFSTELLSLNPITLDIRKGVVIFFVLFLSLAAGTIVTAIVWIRRDTTVATLRKAASP
jgi:hypothetical protein